MVFSISLINKTTFIDLVDNFNFTGLSDGVYFYKVIIFNKIGRSISTEIRKIVIDSTPPEIKYKNGTKESDFYLNQSNLFINVNITEDNFESMVFNLFNSSGQLIDQFEFKDETDEIDFEDLEDGVYFYNVSVRDKAGTVISTETRNITIDTSPPEIEYEDKTPFDNSLLTNNSLAINIDITESNVKKIIFTLFDENFNIYKQKNYGELVTKHVFEDLVPGVYRYVVSVEDKIGLIKNVSERKITKILPTSFGGESTDLTKHDLERIPNLTFEDTRNGKIIYKSTINLSGIFDIDSVIKIDFNKIEVNSTNASNLDKPATLFLYDLNFVNPRILKDGEICAPDICSILDYLDGTLVFKVTNFSIYTIEEGPPVEELDDGDDISSLFDSSSGGADIEEECTPDVNACDGLMCGTVDDGCGTLVLCGICDLGFRCSVNGECVVGECTPDSNSCGEFVCGGVDDGCGNIVSCGICGLGYSCSEGECIAKKKFNKEGYVQIFGYFIITLIVILTLILFSYLYKHRKYGGGFNFQGPKSKILFDYINKMKTDGLSKKDIKNQLVGDGGWPKDIVEEAFKRMKM